MSQTKPTDVLDRYFASPKAADGSLWYDIRALPIEGRGWEGEERLMPFDRLPARLKPLVREGLWTLSEFSAGICVRFVTDAKSIGARWKLRNPKLAPPQMFREVQYAATGQGSESKVPALVEGRGPGSSVRPEAPPPRAP